MRLIMVNAPEGKAPDEARIAFSSEIEKVSFGQVESVIATASSTRIFTAARILRFPSASRAPSFQKRRFGS